MALRLLPAIFMDNEEDDDGNFTKWMSSYWGHGAEGGRDRKRSFRRPARTHTDRRSSLPTVSQLDAMKLSKLHAATLAQSHVKTREEKAEARPHQRARRASSDDGCRPKSAISENRITTIPELTEYFERRLRVHDDRTASRHDDDRCGLISHEHMCESGGVEELHCSHRFHKEAARRSEQGHRRRPSGERRRSADGPVSTEKEEQHELRRQLSLRRHR